MMMTVDRTEDGIAVVSDGEKHFDVPLSLFDGEVREGDVIVKTSDGRFRRDKAGTEKRRKKLLDLQNSLWNE